MRKARFKFIATNAPRVAEAILEASLEGRFIPIVGNWEVLQSLGELLESPACSDVEIEAYREEGEKRVTYSKTEFLVALRHNIEMRPQSDSTEPLEVLSSLSEVGNAILGVKDIWDAVAVLTNRLGPKVGKHLETLLADEIDANIDGG